MYVLLAAGVGAVRGRRTACRIGLAAYLLDRGHWVEYNPEQLRRWQRHTYIPVEVSKYVCTHKADLQPEKGRRGQTNKIAAAQESRLSAVGLTF